MDCSALLSDGQLNRRRSAVPAGRWPSTACDREDARRSPAFVSLNSEADPTFDPGAGGGTRDVAEV